MFILFNVVGKQTESYVRPTVPCLKREHIFEISKYKWKVKAKEEFCFSKAM